MSIVNDKIDIENAQKRAFGGFAAKNMEKPLKGFLEWPLTLLRALLIRIRAFVGLGDFGGIFRTICQKCLWELYQLMIQFGI